MLAGPISGGDLEHAWETYAGSKLESKAFDAFPEALKFIDLDQARPRFTSEALGLGKLIFVTTEISGQLNQRDWIGAEGGCSSLRNLFF